MHLGVEAGVRFELHKIFRTSYQLSLSAYSTYVNSTYSGDRFITISNQTVNISGNELPYAPDFTFTGALELATQLGLGFDLSATYVGDQFTDELNTIEASPSGETGLMKSFITADLTASYLIKDFNSSIYLSVKNLFDERYIASRRPQGIKVGLHRFISAGIEVTF
jgi:Fe(3+) dicitrate transport protein